MARRYLIWPSRAILLAAASLLFPGCGGEPTPPAEPFLSRLDFSPAVGAASLPDIEVGPFLPIATELDRWSFQGDAGRRLPAEDAPESSGVILAAAPLTGYLYLLREDRYDLHRINQVRVTTAFKGHGNLEVRFILTNRTWLSSERVYLPVSPDPVPVDVDLVVPVDLEPAEADGLLLVVQGKNRWMELVGVECRFVPLGRRLPDGAGPPERVTVRQADEVVESRPGEGVTLERPLELTLDVPVAGRLRLSVGQPEIVRRLCTASRLTLVIRPVGGEPGSEASFVLADGEHFEGAWSDHDVDLSRWAGRRVVLRLDVEDTGPPGSAARAAWAVADAHLVRSGDERPSVLLVTSDTHRADHLGVARSGVTVTTPALDALAARGVLFEDCFAPANVTNPSHIALFTGAHPRDTGILSNQQPLAEAASTLAETFRDAGYRTFAAVATRHLGDESSGLGQGFDRMNWPTGSPRDAEHVVDLAESWLDEAGSGPVFLWVHLFDAHGPYDPPAGFDRLDYDMQKDPFDPSLPEVVPDLVLPSDLRGIRDLEYPRALYRSEIASLDAQLERLLERPRFRNGYTAFVSDHGEGMGHHGVYFQHSGLHPEMVHVPLLIAGGGVPAGMRVAEPVSHQDLGRTLLDLVGLERSSFPGRSLTDRWLRTARRRSEPRFMLSGSYRAVSVSYQRLYAILHLAEGSDQPKKRSQLNESALHQLELFDRSVDPECTRDLVNERPALARKMRQRLVRWLQAAPDETWAVDRPADAGQLAELMALGYTAAPERGASLWVEDDCSWCRRFD